jgi:hypothetical protein
MAENSSATKDMLKEIMGQFSQFDTDMKIGTRVRGLFSLAFGFMFLFVFLFSNAEKKMRTVSLRHKRRWPN